MQIKSYRMDYGEINLFSSINNISVDIVKQYKLMYEKEINGDTIDDNIKNALSSLLIREQKLYEEGMKKEERAEAFYYLTSRPNSDINPLLSLDYGDILKLAFDSKSCFRRVRSNLEVFVKNNQIINLPDEALEKRTMASILPKEVYKKMIISCAKQEETLDRVLYMDIFNTFLNLLDDEIKKPLNTSIKDDLIGVKYNIISSNIWLEDKFIKDDYKITDPTYTAYNVIKNLYGIKDDLMEYVFKVNFETGLQQIINSMIILGDKNFSNENYKNILVNHIMLKSILLVADSNALEDICIDTLNNFKGKINDSNIGNYLINNFIENKPDKNKVLTLKLFTSYN